MSQGSRSATATLNVLAVVGDPADTTLLTAHVAKAGHQLRIVGEGAAAVRAILDEAPDAVVVDLGLPGRDGYELTRTLCYLLKVRPLLIALSDTPGLRDRCRAEGFDLYLEKPVDVRALSEALQARATAIVSAAARSSANAAATATKPNAKGERRRIGRFPPCGRVQVRCYRGTRDLGVNIGRGVLDISESGMRILVKAALDKGEEVTVRIEGDGHVRPVHRGGKIVWCAAAAEGEFQVGIQFHTPLEVTDVFILT